ncbi:MAG: phytanoyl-CoA dioxygenase family protein [Halioglobus sp.]
MAGNDFDIMAAVQALDGFHTDERTAEAELLAQMTAAGAARCERSREKTLTPPRATDLFADTVGLPEIQADQLNRETLAAGILHHGALLVRQLYSGEVLTRLQHLASTREEADRADNLPLGCTPHTFFQLLNIYQQCGLLDAVREYLDDEPVIFAQRSKLRQHRAKRDKYAAIPWHQDVNFFGRKSYAVNCWAAVTPCGEDNPGLNIIPVRTEERQGWDGDDGIAPLDYGRSMTPDELDNFRGKQPIAHPVLQPGDALLFDEMTVHQTALKRWARAEQVVTISWFFRASGFPAWGTPLAI